MCRGFFAVCLAAAGVGLLAAGVPAQPASAGVQPPTGIQLLQDLRSFRELGTVLFIAAHPDDENNQLLAYLAHGRYYRTAYLCLNRGDGGQNELGPEFGELLGVIRTQESLAARRVDGARQFFTRAYDFGYSKTPEETLRIWDHQQVLSDVVRVIRQFRPDVMIARFPPPPSNTHGHHTSSTILAQEAFKIAGDPKAFPEQIAQGLQPWQPKRLFFNGGNGAGVVNLNDGGNEPVSGEAFSSIAARARANHKSQGFGAAGAPRGGGAARNEPLFLLDGQPASADIMDGVDTTWSRYAGGADISQMADAAIAQFKQDDPSASVPALLAIRSKLAALPSDPVVDEKRAQFDRILQGCLGLTVETTIPNAEVVPGEELKMHSTALVRSAIPVQWLGTGYPNGVDRLAPAGAMALTMGQPSSRDSTQTLPAQTPLSTPYWLRDDHTVGMLTVADPALIGRPDNPPIYPLRQIFKVGDQTLSIADEPVQVTGDSQKGESRRRLDVISPVVLSFANEVQLFAPGASKSVEVEVTAFRPASNGVLRLAAPAGWKTSPASQPFQLAAVGDKARVAFTITAPAQPTGANITAIANVNGVDYSNERIVIRYDHIPVQMLQPPARFRAVALDLATRGKKVGYLPGAGDSLTAALEQMGYAVTQLTGADLTPEKLQGLDAVVIGVRAFNERTDLAANLPGLFAYVEQGGVVIAQYNRPNGLRTPQLGPYALSIAGSGPNAPRFRVTDENAPVTLLVPEDRAFTTPNKITSADFDGWVQERGAYFPDTWDQEHYVQLLGMSDPGETQPSSSLLVAKYGKGHYVYTSLGWFRQLPAGVPGAYRLFANLLALGQ